MMKKILSLVLVCCFMLPLCAYAENPHVKVDTFRTSTKKTEITFDADVLMPGSGSLPLYRVNLVSFSEADIRTIAEGFGFSSSSKPKHTAYDDSGSSYKGYSRDQYTFVDGKKTLRFFNEYINGKPFGTSYEYELSGVPVEFTTNSKLLPVQNNNDEEMAAAQEQAVLLATNIAPDLSLNASGIISGAPWSYGDDLSASTNKSTAECAYMFIFSRSFHQVPVTVTGTRMGSHNDYMRVIPEEQLSIVVKDGKVVQARFMSPYNLEEAGSVANQDLLPFDQIMEIAEHILPLMCMTRESQWATEEKPEKLVVHRIAFGYVRINDKDNPNEYILVPAWDFFVSHTHVWRQYENGTYVIREVPENYAIDSYLTINAIDGTVIDRTYGY